MTNKIYLDVIETGYIPIIKNKTDKLNLLPLAVVTVMDNEGKIQPLICFAPESTEEDYDYNYNEELEYRGLNKEYTYFPIKYNPYTGEEFEFIINKIDDISKDIYNLLNKYNELNNKRDNNKIIKEKHEIINKINSQYKDSIPIVYIDDSINIFKDGRESSLICNDNLMKSHFAYLYAVYQKENNILE